MKKLLCLILALVMVFIMVGCNRQIFDTTFNYDQAIISLPDGTVVSGKVDSWKDYADSDQLQIVIDGVSYLVHSMNAVLIRS